MLFLHDPVDEFVINSLRQYDGHDFINIDAEDVDIGQPDAAATAESLSPADATALVDWLKTTLGASVADVKVSKRLVNHPAMVVGHDSPTMRNMLKMLDPTTAAGIKPLPVSHVRSVLRPRRERVRPACPLTPPPPNPCARLCQPPWLACLALNI